MGKSRRSTVRIESSDLSTQPEGWVEMDDCLKARHWAYMPDLQPLADLQREKSAEKRVAGYKVWHKFLASFVAGWNWKGKDGKGYSKPADNAEVFGEIRLQEFLWLIGQVDEVVGEDIELPKPTDSD